MRFKKTVLGAMEKCYATLGLEIAGQPYLFFASEGQGHLRVYFGDNFSQSTVITEGGGGTMSIVPVKRKEGWVMLSRGFYSMVESQDSSIEIIRYKDGSFVPEKIAALPYLHRFGIVTAKDGTEYVIAATVADYKKDKEDWEHPGHLYYAVLPENIDDTFELALIRLPGDYYMNHGFDIAVENGCEKAFIGCREGVFSVTPPNAKGEGFIIEQLMDIPISDVGILDIDDDGKIEIAALLPFHGNECKVFKKQGKKVTELYCYPVENGFYHAVIGATLGREKVFVLGSRLIAAQLFLLRWDGENQSFYPQVIEDGVGPSNVAVLHTSSSDIILSANRMIAEAAIYTYIKEQ